MSEQRHGTSIAWTHGDGYRGETWNPVTGCSHVSDGCTNCYAETLTARFAGQPGWIAEHRPWTKPNAKHNVFLRPDRLDQPLHWKQPRMVFVNSMSDLFHEEIPLDFLAQVWDVMVRTPQHIYQILTKRPERVTEALGPRGIDFYAVEGPVPFPQPNIWIGVSIESARHNDRADALREIPAAVRFISAEPLLSSLYDGRGHASNNADAGAGEAGGVRGLRTTPDDRAVPEDRESSDLLRDMPGGARATRAPLDLTGIDWLIVGGESGGRDARPMHPDWARELRDACLALDGPVCCGQPDYPAECCGQFLRTGECCSNPVQGGPECCGEPVPGQRPAFFFKQWGSWSPDEVNERGHRYVGYHAGRISDLPQPRAERIAYRGTSPKSGGRLLDAREWNEMPLGLGGEGLAA